jgi:hypothetical protein
MVARRALALVLVASLLAAASAWFGEPKKALDDGENTKGRGDPSTKRDKT